MAKKSKGAGINAGMWFGGFSSHYDVPYFEKPPAPKPQHLTDAQKQAESKINQAVRRG